MSSSDKTITIGIETTANTAGAEKAEASIKKLDKAAEDAAIHAEMQAQRNARTSGVTFDNPVYMDVAANEAAAAATAKLGKSAGDTGSEIHQLTGKVDANNASTKKLGFVAQNASYQIQDFAVQVGGGTSAATAFAQQAPQLISSLASAGVMSGGAALALSGIAAIIPILVYGLPALAKAFGSVEEAQKSLPGGAEAIQRLTKALKDITIVQDAVSRPTLAKAYEANILAIDRETIAFKANLALKVEAIKQEQELAALKQKELVRVVDAKQRDGTYTPQEADLKRAQILEQGVVQDLAARKTLRQVEVDAMAKDLAAAKDKLSAAQTTAAQAQEELAARKAEIAKARADETQRKALDQEISELKKKQLVNYEIGTMPLNSQASFGGGVVSDADKTKALAEANAQWNQIQAMQTEIARRNLPSVTKYETPVVQSDGTTKMEMQSQADRINKELVAGGQRVLLDGTVVVVKSLDELNGTLGQFAKAVDEKGKEVAAKTADLSTVTAKTTQADAFDMTKTQLDNPAIKEVEAKVAANVTQLADSIIAKIPDSVNDPAVQKINDKLKQITADGVQRPEVQEAQDLLLQLQQKLKMGSDASRTAYQQIIANQDTSIGLFNTVMAKINLQASQLDEVRIGLGTIQAQQGNPNP